ncbi:MAG TPA: hypothetical protein PKC51_12785, partial [Ferruginibacter sp.]|nr:hypothetical protein [Ferruginibacter sp.]
MRKEQALAGAIKIVTIDDGFHAGGAKAHLVFYFISGLKPGAIDELVVLLNYFILPEFPAFQQRRKIAAIDDGFHAGGAKAHLFFYFISGLKPGA